MTELLTFAGNHPVLAVALALVAGAIFLTAFILLLHRNCCHFEL